jgi:endo-1,4-beta-D-glucanase Y
MRRSTALSCIQAVVFALPVFVACAAGDSGTNPGGGDGGSSGGSGGPSSGSGGGLSSSGGSGGSRDGGSSGFGGSNSSGSSGSSGASGSSSGSGSSGASSGSGVDSGLVNVDSGVRACMPASANVVSDFEEGTGTMIKQGGRSGWWYVFSDTGGTPPSPPAVTDGPIAVSNAVDNPSMCNKYEMHSTASGHTGTMGYAGVGATFIPGSGMNKSVYDLSAYDGIQFDLKAGGGSQGPMYFEVLTKESQPAPAGVATNKVIDLFNTRGYVLTASGMTPSGTSTAIPTSMTTVYVPFSLLVPRYFPEPNGCGTAMCQSPAFVPANALGFQFSAYNDFSTAGSYDLWIDNVALFTGDTGLTPPGMTMPAFKDGSTGWSCTKPTFLGGKSAAGKYLLWAYRNWKTNYVKTNGSANIVVSPEVNGGSVVSEGIAYGMLIAAYMGDRPLFDGLWSYWSAHTATGHLMNWRYDISGNNMTGGGSATDADEDAGFALYVASKVWGSSYNANRDAVIADIWTYDFDHTSNLPTYGSNAGNSTTNNPTNPSYFAPAYYPIFGSNFANATSAVYAALNRMAALGPLPPAWCSASGGTSCATVGGGSYANATDYQYDAHRVPWRVGIDYCWNGSTAASSYLGHISQFFSGQVSSGGIDSLYDQYTTANPPLVCTGCTPAAQPNSMSLVGTATVGALAGSYAGFVNAGWQFVLDGLNRGTPNVLATGNNYYTYYNTTVGLLTALTLSGNFYKL